MSIEGCPHGPTFMTGRSRGLPTVQSRQARRGEIAILYGAGAKEL